MQPIGVSVNVNFLAGLVLFLGAKPKPRVIAAACVAGACLGAYLGLQGTPVQKALEALSYCGAGAIPAVWMMPLLRLPSDLKLLGKLVLLPAFALLTTFFLNAGSHNLTYDHFLYAFDGSLGLQPAFWAGQLLSSPAWIGELTRGLYNALPIFLVLAYLIAERQSSAKARSLFVWILLLGICGAGCYMIFPAVGTYWLFAKVFPFHPPALTATPLVPIAVSALAPRNCMPSMHTSWALVAFWAAGKCRLPWRLALRGLLAIMLLQTLVYHYLIDMIVAVPFTLAIFAVTMADVPWTSIERRAALATGVASVAAWMIALRWGTWMFQSSPLAPWAAIVATVALNAWMWRVLERAKAPAVSTVRASELLSLQAKA